MQTYSHCSGASRPRAILTLLLVVGLLSGSCSDKLESAPAATAAGESSIIVQSTPPQAEPIPQGQTQSCEQEQERVRNGMRAILLDFQRSESPKPVELLVDVDRRIRVLLASRPAYRPCLDDSRIFDPQWAQMGVELGYWVDLTYSGVLLDEAHKRDPNSALRSYTLFSTVFGTTPTHGLGVMPNINAAFRYISEFPDGPFAKDALLTIADFHKDLFMVLRDNRRDYKYDCYKSYIQKAASSDQKARAKRIALSYYQKVLKIEPSNEQVRLFEGEVERETVKSWSFCAD